MKRKLALFAIVLAVLMLIPAFALAAESDEKGPLDTVAFQSGYDTPTKDTYKVGEKFNPAGLKVDITYQGSTTTYSKAVSLSDGFTTSMDGKAFTTDDIGKTKITIYYTKNGSTVAISPQIEVTVTGADRTLDSLTADGTKLKKKYYYVGESFDKTGLTAEAEYVDHTGTAISPTQTLVASQLTASHTFTADEAGTKVPIKVSYTSGGVTESDTTSVEVYVYALDSLTVTAPTKTHYYVGESFDKTGAEVTANFTASDSNTDSKILALDDVSVEAVTYNADDAGKPVDVKVSYSYANKKKTQSITTYVYNLKSLTASGTKKIIYFAGETFDKTGTEVMATYQYGDTGDTGYKKQEKTIDINKAFVDAKTYTDSDVNDAQANTPIQIKATFTYGDTTAVALIDTYVYQLDESDISVENPPYKKIYIAGESFNPAGMVLKAKFIANNNDKTEKEKVLSGYSYSKTPFVQADVGKTEVNVYYYYAGDRKTIKVSGLTIKDLPAEYIYLDKASLFMTSGESVRLNAIVLPEGSTDDITWDVDSNGKSVATVDTYGMVSAVSKGSTYVIATAGSMSVKCYVNVEEGTPITSIKFNKTNLNLLLGDSTKLSPTIVPTDAKANINWSSSNSNIVSVNSDGTIKGLKEGSAVISADCDGLEAKMNVTVSKTLSTTGTVVNCQRRVNVRAKASGSSSSVGYAYLGQTYTILDEVDNWYKIQFTSSKVGYIWKKYLSTNGGKDYTPVSDTSTAATVTTETVSVTATETDVTITAGTTSATTATKVTIVNCTRYVYIRKGASTAYSKIGHAAPGAVFTLKGATGDWYAIDYNGQVGYIHKDFCQLG